MDEIFRKAAASALFAWKQDESGLEDLVSDLWVWYLERRATRDKLQKSDKFHARRMVYTHCLQELANKSLLNDRFNGKNLYSSDSVRSALKGESRNRYLVDVLPGALDALSGQNPAQAEAVRSRYQDGEVPARGSSEEAKLKRAVKSLTEHVNVITITAGVDAEGNVSEGPGSRHAVFPNTRRSHGSGHSDPTGNTAIMLIEHPELRDEYLHEDSLTEFLGGRGYAQPA